MKLTIEHLSKQYRRDFWGLRDFDLELGPGVIGLLGPERRGQVHADAHAGDHHPAHRGTIRGTGPISSNRRIALRAVLGYLPQDFGVYPNLTAVEFLEYMAAIKGLDAKPRAAGSTNCWQWSTWSTPRNARWAAIPAG